MPSRFRRTLPFFLAAVPLGGLAVSVALPIATSSCGNGTVPPPTDAGPQLRPGDLCDKPQASTQRARFSPAQIFLAPCSGDGAACTTRDVQLILEPDVCSPTPFKLASSSSDLDAPAGGAFDLYAASQKLTIHGAKNAGSYTLTATIPASDGTSITTDLDVEVIAPSAQACSGTASMPMLAEAQTLSGTGGLAGASIGLPAHANAPNSGSYLWSVAPFPASLACATMALPAGATALGPAITFGPNQDLAFQREVPLSVPANPALLPTPAHLRHVQILYSGPAFKKPRVIPVADLRFEQVGGAWAATFKAPRLGTYQAIVPADAGTHTLKRHLTHRAVTGISMGGIGSSMFGLRHHDKFDVVAPLGGPGSWTWFMSYIERNHLAGFRPIAKGTTLPDIQLTKTPCMTNADCKSDETCLGLTPTKMGGCTLMPAPVDVYEHTQTFNNWWHEIPSTGTGGTFARQDYAQIFSDLALLFGNPNSDNFMKGAEFLPAGVPLTDPSVTGGIGPGCSIWVDPIDGDPNEAQQQQYANECPVDRCSHPLVLQNYFDAKFNPDGIFPVITVCDGTPSDNAQSPWANAWNAAGPNQYPLEVALAVDYNGNSVRDELEPIISQGHEPWRDTGADGLFDKDEPGYQQGVNDDPNGDDYNPQYNPSGTENNGHYELGEPFDDWGIDGVPGTKQQPPYPIGWQKPGDGYDVGEGDGQFTVTRGLQRLWVRDPGNIISGVSTDVPGGPFDDAALSRVDFWTDGGLRDLFNFHVSAQHMIGSLVPRGRAVTYYTNFAEMPGFDPTQPDQFTPIKMNWDEVPGGVLMRYGAIDPTPQDIADGSGQHVGTVTEIALRLQTTLYYIGSRWPEPELRTLAAQSNDNPDPSADICEVNGTCTINFTSSSGRTGPVTINFPPGYANKDELDRRYPVVYLLHGYGQSPQDLGAAIIFVANWMNNSNDSVATRLPKALLVYPDGRCRDGADGKAECMRGSFFADSARDGGLQDEQWWLELMDYIDGHYRTMGESDVDWTE